METKKSIGSKVFWIIAGCVLVILMFFPLFVGGKRMYSEFRAYTSDSYEGQIAHADHSLNYGDKMGRPKSALFLERGYAKIAIAESEKDIESGLADYESAKKASPDFYITALHAIMIPETLAKKGHYEKAIELWEEMLKLSQDIQTDEAAYQRFQDNLSPTSKTFWTYEKFAKETPVTLYFLVTTKSSAHQDVRRGLAFAEALAKETPASYYLHLLAISQAANGRFEEALKTLDATEEAYKKEPNPREYFFARLNRDRVLFRAKKPLVTDRY
jgi:tetratricopeptide (TPR) repeat protein